MQAFQRMRIALAQTAIIWEDKEQNFKKAEEQIKDAVNHNTEAIFFPEMSFTGFSMNTDATKESGDGTVRRMQSIAGQYRMAAGFGWVRDCGGKCENHYTVVDRSGKIISDYVKLHPFSYSGEHLQFRGGDTLSYFSLYGIACSTFICYDLRFPEIFQAASKRRTGLQSAADTGGRSSRRARLKTRFIYWRSTVQGISGESVMRVTAA